MDCLYKNHLVNLSPAGILADGLDVDTDKQLRNHFIKWDDGYNDRLYNYLSNLVNQCKTSFKSDGGHQEKHSIKIDNNFTRDCI